VYGLLGYVGSIDAQLSYENSSFFNHSSFAQNDDDDDE